jgi:hypothetical protein
MNKADLSANIAREWIERNNVDAIIDVPNSAVALAMRNVVQRSNKTPLVSGASSYDLTGKACSSNLVHWSYDTYALSNGTARAVFAEGSKTWFTLIADYAFGRAMEAEVENVVQKLGGAVVGGRADADQHPGLLLVPAAGAGLEGRDHRPDQCRRRQHQLDQAIGRTRHSPGRPESGGDRALSQRRAFARAESRARPAIHRILLLEFERRHARLGQALRAAQ